MKMLGWKNLVPGMIVTLLCSGISFAQDALLPGLGLRFRARAREHFEWSRIRFTDEGPAGHFTGFSNTLNLWLEKPFHYSFGFGLGPILGSYGRAGGQAIEGVGEKIRLWNFGFEAKMFPAPERIGAFARAGMYGEILDTNGSPGTKSGFGYLLSAGWEFAAGTVGIAPEIGFRHVLLQGGGSIVQLSTSVGVHFYSL